MSFVQELEVERRAARHRLELPATPSRYGPVPEREMLPEGLSVSRTYWALVDGNLKPGTKGRISLPVPSPGRSSRDERGKDVREAGVQPALTLYHVRGYRDGISWVELTPMTGEEVTISSSQPAAALVHSPVSNGIFIINYNM